MVDTKNNQCIPKKPQQANSSDKKDKDKEKDKPNPTKPEPLEFQICDWNSYHEIDGDDEEKYVIQLFGRTEDDKDVCLKVTGFTPFFYVEVPTNWTDRQADKFVDILKNKVAWCTNNNPNYDYDLSKSLIKHQLRQKHKFYNFTNKKLFKFVLLVFKSHIAMKEFANILSRPLKASGLTKEPMLYQRYESNIEPHIRFMHINNLSSCGWASVDKTKMKEDKDYSYCDHSYRVDWKDVKPCDNDNRMAPFKIMGYDIECISCDCNFPQEERKSDKIIQIGITMYRYGSMNCYEQHMLALKECAPIKGAKVECYKTEKGLIRGWARKVRDLRPDFKAGYNNFGFDDKYIYNRILRIDQETADKQGISVESMENRFLDEILQIMGKVNNEYLWKTGQIKQSSNPHPNQSGAYYGPSLTYFEIKNLSSSALGDNELKFFQVPGILSIDMMKVIQRDHRLIGYKLDNVSANFITEEMDKDKLKADGEISDGKMKVNIYTRSTKALDVNSYIQIMVDDGYSSTPLREGAKYKVLDIETITEKKFNAKDKKEDTISYQCIKTEINEKDIPNLREAILNPLLKIYWTFAKDDMHHTLINKYFKEGDPKRIRDVAKYCLKDCKLVNLLLAKLEIIVNSIGMAKVCHVPLSYLFLRGQGVKIFSLVSKKCREKNFLIPVLRRKKKDANGDEDETYEGATVITPKPDVYLSPIGVLDYSSLYPNSMRERNLSQECYVNDKKYDNLPGYIYHDVYIVMKDKKGKIIRNIDGTAQKEHHRFAQEIITEEQMNDELKDVITKINNDMENSIAKIKGQCFYTDVQRKDKIANEKAKYDKKIKEINANKDLSDKKKKKLLDSTKEELDDIIQELVEVEDRIKKEKEKTDAKIKEISGNAKLSDSDKKKKIDEENAKFASLANKIGEELDLTDEQKEELITVEKEKAKKRISDEKEKKYNVVNGQSVRYGILPEILTELLNKRKETNGRLGQEKDSFIKAILNALQLAFKVTANSLYGQTGAPTSPIYFLSIAASTTAIGRERLHYAKKMVEDNFPGSEVIYGDSVTGDTPLVCRDPNGDVSVTTIEALGGSWTSYDQFKAGDSNRRGKEQSSVNCQIWTANGWAKIKRVIRHNTTKKIYRVLTPTGCVDVTEDHSLLDKNKNKIKPVDCSIGTELLHGFMEANNKYSNISKEEAYVWGVFLNSGYSCHGSDGYTWYISDNNEHAIKKCKDYMRMSVENMEFKITDKKGNLQICSLEPVNKKDEKQLAKKYDKNFWNGDFRAVPMEILNSSLEIKQSFLDGYLATNKFPNKCIIRGKLAVQCMYYLLKSLGYNVVIDNDQNEYFCLSFGKEAIKGATAIKEKMFIREVRLCSPYPIDYVYDLETEDGTFHAGIGEMIVKNTDSIFINFHLKDANGNERTDKQALIETIELCQKAAKIINDSVPKPQGIVYEKTLHPFILVAKKKYVGLLFQKDPNEYSLKSMGIVLKRRDNAPIVKIVVGGIIDHLLKNRDIDKAVDYTKEVLRKLMDGKYPIDKFIISKTLKAKYKKPSTIAHKVLADRMAVRNPGNKPQINDRIPFVFIVKDMGKKKKKDILQGDLIEHPEYVVKNDLKIDYLYYLEHQIINPASQILELMMSPKEVDKMFKKFIIEEENKRKGRQSMEKWMDYSTIKIKEAKLPVKIMKKPESKIEEKYRNLPVVGKTKKHECQNLNKWIDSNNKVNSDDWQPTTVDDDE